MARDHSEGNTFMSFPGLASRKGALRVAAVGAIAALTTVLLPVQAASAAPGNACDNRSNNTYQKLLECMTLEGVREHQAAFQKIADNSDDPVYPGTRAAGTVGYAESVEYVAGLLRDAGYEVTLDPVDDHLQLPGGAAPAHPGRSRATRPVSSPAAARGGRGQRHPGRHQPHAAAAGPRAAASRPTSPASTSAVTTDIALVQRGTCFFGTKAVLRRAGRRRGGDHLQPGQHPERAGLIVADATSVDPPIPVHPDQSPTASPWWVRASPTARHWPSRDRPPTSRCCRPRPAPTSTSSPSCPARTRTTS